MWWVLATFIRNAAIEQLQLDQGINCNCNEILRLGTFPTRRVMKRKLPYLQQAMEDEESQVAQCLPT